MELPRAYQMDEVVTIAGLDDTAQDIAVDYRVFMIANVGAQPLYFNPKTTATAANGFLVPAGTVFPQYFSCPGNLSVISNSTGTDVAILYLDV